MHFHYCTINETCVSKRDGVRLFIRWMRYRESVAAWKTRVNVYRGIFLVVAEEHDCWERHVASLSLESADVTTKGAVAVNHALHNLPFSFNSALSSPAFSAVPELLLASMGMERPVTAFTG